MDPETWYSANEESFKMAYFGRSFHFKQLLNERDSLGTGKECGGLRKRTMAFFQIYQFFTNSDLKYFQITFGSGDCMIINT